jgi:hypothetical protein
VLFIQRFPFWENDPKSPYFEDKMFEFAIFRLWVPAGRQTKAKIFLFFFSPSLTCSQIWLSLLNQI